MGAGTRVRHIATGRIGTVYHVGDATAAAEMDCGAIVGDYFDAWEALVD